MTCRCMATTKEEQRSGVVTVGCACTGGTSSLRCRWPWQQPLHHCRDVGPETYNSLRSQKTARAEATNTAPRSQTTSVAGDTEFFSLFEEELGGTRPDRMYEVRPQERDQRHTVEQIVITVLFAPSLDVPVPQMGNLVDVCRLFDVLIPEQAIEVPKISPTPPSSSQAPCALR